MLAYFITDLTILFYYLSIYLSIIVIGLIGAFFVCVFPIITKLNFTSNSFIAQFYCFLLLILALFIIALPAFRNRVINITGTSMEPNFTAGESYLGIDRKIIVNVASYWWRSTSLVRGEVYSIEAEDGSKILKRLIGIPGDVIQIKDGRLYINYIPAEYKHISNNLYLEWHELYGSYGGMFEKFNFFRSAFYAYKCHLNKSNNDKDTVNICLMDNEYWVMGDNREVSYDSRNFGPIAKESFDCLVKDINLNSIPMLPKILVCSVTQLVTILSNITVKLRNIFIVIAIVYVFIQSLDINTTHIINFYLK